MTYTLSPGPVHSIVQNTVYSLPASRCVVQSGAVIEASLSSTTGFVSVSASTTGTELFAKFVRCTTANTTICVKKT